MKHATGLERFIETMTSKYRMECTGLLGENDGYDAEQEWLTRIELLADMIRFAEKCKEGEPKQPATKTIEGFVTRVCVETASNEGLFSMSTKPDGMFRVPATLTIQLPEAEKFLRKIND